MQTQQPELTSISSAELRAALEKLKVLEQEERARRALLDPWFWLTECTKTKDEQDLANPYKPFPQKEYLRLTLKILQKEPILFLEKSRTMMCSWLVSARFAHLGFTNPAVGVVFQSEDEDRAVHDVDYVKTLWEQSDPVLKAKWPLKKRFDLQANTSFELANGSWFLAIPGNPDKIRSEHPTAVVLDEAAHIKEGSKSFSVAGATRCKWLVALSSANPGWFRTKTEFATPIDWPQEYL